MLRIIKKYIDADYIQYLTGNQAIEEAKKNGDADVIIINGIKKYSIPDDFYVLNENKKIRKLELSNNIKIDLIDNSKSSGKDSIFNYFKNNYDDRIYILELSGGKVINIKEVFIP
jgi:hypothetical protein